MVLWIMMTFYRELLKLSSDIACMKFQIASITKTFTLFTRKAAENVTLD